MNNLHNNNCYEVYKNGLCCSCGLCEGICPSDSISFSIDKLGFLKPVINKKTCLKCGLCSKYCPGVNIEIPLSKDYCYMFGHTKNHELRYHSSSGGITTELLTFLINKKIVDRVVVVATSPSQIIPKPILTNNLDVIRSACTSKYIPVPTASILKEIKKKNGKVAIVCLPCQAMGIRKYIRKRPQLSSKIEIIITLFCNHIPSYNGTQYILRKNIKNQNQIEKLSYRGGGWPGFISVKTEQKIFTMSYRKTCSKGFGLFFKNFRCQICADPFGEYGDISMGDAYFLSGKDFIGSTFCIVRNKKIKDVIISLMKNELACFEYGPDENTFSETYKVLINRKRKTEFVISAFEKLGKVLKINYDGRRIDLKWLQAYLILLSTYFYRIGNYKIMWPFIPYLSILLKLLNIFQVNIYRKFKK